MSFQAAGAGNARADVLQGPAIVVSAYSSVSMLCRKQSQRAPIFNEIAFHVLFMRHSVHYDKVKQVDRWEAHLPQEIPSLAVRRSWR
jgi:hypothetical protein